MSDLQSKRQVRQNGRQNRKPQNKQPVQNGNVQKQVKVQKRRQRVKRVAQVSDVKKINDSSKDTNMIVQTTAMVQSVDTLRRQSVISQSAITEFLSSFMSKLVELGITRAQDIDLEKFYAGYKHMIRGVTTMIQGTAGLDEMPRIIADWVHALSQKEVKFHGFAAVSFGWDEFSTTPADYTSLAIGNTRWQLMVPSNPGTPLWNSPASVSVSAPDAELYSYFLRYVNGLSQVPHIKGALQTIEWNKYKSVMERDASAFAYTYPYFGLTADSTTAYWNNAESVVPITAPDLAKYAPYPNQGPIEFASRKFCATSGGSPVFLSSLCDLPRSYFNKAPPIIKQLDILDVATRLIAWYTKLCQKRAQASPSVVNVTLNMTYQDFLVMCRQLVLSNSPSQFIAQYEGCNSYAPTSNYFQPFYVTASTQPSEIYGNIRIPQVLAENLAMLQSIAYKYSYSKVSKNNFDRFLPVWGYYPNDPPLNPGIEIFDQTYNMFLPAGSGGQLSLSLADGAYGGGNNPNFVNLNGAYYTALVNIWNDAVFYEQEVASEMSYNNKAFCGKIPYALMCTKVVTSENPSVLPVAHQKVMDKFYGKKDKGVNPKLPPGNPFYLHFETLITSVPLPREIHQVLNLLITPTIRVDPSQATPLNLAQYKTAVGELIEIPYDLTNTPTVFASATWFADNCVTGIGRDSNAELAVAFQIMTGKGEGGAIADILAGILGSVIPSGAPVFKTLASLVPI